MNRPQGIIVDLDGTIADNAYRVKYVDGSQKKDWKMFNALSGQDPVVGWCLELVKAFHAIGHKIVFLTAREGYEETRVLTEDWLQRHVGALGIEYQLFMRAEKDYRPDFIVKQEIYNMQIAPFVEVLFAIDDKAGVCNMWRATGVPALHCSDY